MQASVDNLVITEQAASLMPCIGPDGEWGTVGGVALAHSLTRGSYVGVVELLESMNTQEMVGVLRECGFDAPWHEVDEKALLALMADDLLEASRMRGNGFELAKGKGLGQERVLDDGFVVTRDAGGLDLTAAEAIQDLLNEKALVVGLVGEARVAERASLLFVAGQALEKSVQGFGFEGVSGKYVVPMSMEDAVDLHRQAAAAIAVESARSAVGVWGDGGKVGLVHEWVPDNVQRVLNMSASVLAAESLVRAIEGGAIAEHAGAIGERRYTQLLTEHGYDIDALTVAEQAEQLGLSMTEADTKRGQYFGSVVGVDHRAAIVKFNRSSVVELPFDALAEEQEKLRNGDNVRMRFADGQLTVSMVEKARKAEVGR